jgi:sigma-B regulation protein RsbU (phosphoserine phosphatase)
MIESKAFYRKIEQALAGSERARTRERFALRVAPRLFEQLSGLLGLVSVHVYERRGPKLAAARSWGEERPDLHELLAARLTSTGDDGIRELPWVGETNAGRVGLFAVGGLDGPLIAVFPFVPDGLRTVPTRAELLSALTSIVYAIRQRMERGRLEDLFEQARTIQLSLLPPGRREFAGYDVFAASTPAQSVGGDLYDYHHVDPETLGIAVADASGHGLPAALQARDVATGLRMGVERDLKITRMVERLNRVIHQSGLSSRFISLFFGELERNGKPVATSTPAIRRRCCSTRAACASCPWAACCWAPIPSRRTSWASCTWTAARPARLLRRRDRARGRDGHIYGRERLGEWLRETRRCRPRTRSATCSRGSPSTAAAARSRTTSR